MTDWQPISTAPRDGTRILAVSRSGVDIAYWNEPSPYYEFKPHPTISNAFVQILTCAEGYWIGTEISPLIEVTHWMPLPPAPKE